MKKKKRNKKKQTLNDIIRKQTMSDAYKQNELNDLNRFYRKDRREVLKYNRNTTKSNFRKYGE